MEKLASPTMNVDGGIGGLSEGLKRRPHVIDFGEAL
jgi:hypothetical protein